MGPNEWPPAVTEPIPSDFGRYLLIGLHVCRYCTVLTGSVPMAETVTNSDIRIGISYVIFGRRLVAQTFKPFGDIHLSVGSSRCCYSIVGAAAMQLEL